MKKIFALLAVFGFFTNTAYGEAVTITKDDVTSALDIEAAINTATGFGSEPGIVILDGSKGSFTYTGPDKSINIAVSNLKLLGIKGATIINCDDGLFFDGVTAGNILIKGIAFQCTGDGIDGLPGLWENVRVQNNLFKAASFGIIIRNPVNWRIRNNTITAGTGQVQAAVAFIGGTDSTIENNALTAFNGVALTNFFASASTGNRVVRNHIEAFERECFWMEKPPKTGWR